MRGTVIHGGRVKPGGCRHGIPNLAKGSELSFDLHDGKMINLRIVRYGPVKPKPVVVAEPVKPMPRITVLPGENDIIRWDDV